MPLGGAVIAGLGLGYNVIKGASQNSKANQIEKGLKDPIYNIPDEFYENQRIAKNMAQIGLPQQQYNNQINDINQNQAQGIAAINNSANPGSGIAATVRAGDKATDNLNAEDAAARLSNQRYFIGQNGLLGQQKLAKQQSDVFDKYTRDFNQVQAYRGAANQNFNNAVNGAIGLGMTGLNNLNDSNPTIPSPKPFERTQGMIDTENGFNQYLASNPTTQTGAPAGFGKQPPLPQLQYSPYVGIQPPYGGQQPQGSPLYIGQGWGY